MSNVVFLADVQDPSTPATVYGKGHLVNLTDEALVRSLNGDGKLALQGASVRGAAVTALGTTTATISWTVDQPCTGMKVDFGTTTAYGSSQAATPASGSGLVAANLTGLTTATTYHYRISVTVGTATTLTADGTFRTN